ncbi:MAG: hypothetical protein WBD63_10100 [Phycisphaerae bacterium]|nr:hypothetical protein [Phycisphaerae bacterium]
MDKTEEGIRLLRILVEAAGGTLGAAENILREPYTDETAKKHESLLTQLQETALAGFFHCASASVLFTDLDSIRGHYGRGLEDAYPGASPTFMSLARTYWTFKVCLIRCGPAPAVCLTLLRGIDLTFAGVFFPTPGVFSQPKWLRETTMRDLIGMSGANFDVEDYLRGNYYL